MKLSQLISGQLIIRDAGKNTPKPDDRRLVMVVGILAIPSGILVPEHQYTVSGYGRNYNPDHPLKTVELTVYEESKTDPPIDRTQELLGMAMGSALTLPIWRV